MKKLFSIIFAIIFIFNICICPVYATTETSQDIVKVNNGIIEGYNELLRYAGLLIDTGIEAQRSTLQFVKDRLVALGFFQNTPTDEEVQDFFDDNITVSPHSTSHHGKDVSYTPDMNLYVKNEISQIMSESPYFYAYTCNVKLRATDFPSGDQYRAWQGFIEQYQNEYYILRVGSSFYLYPLNNDIAFVLGNVRTPYTYVFAYDFDEWSQIRWSDMYKCFSYNSQTYEFTEISNPNGTYAAGGFVIEDYNNIDGQPVTDAGYQWILTFGKNVLVKVYRTLNDLKESNLGISPYYITDSYNTFANTTGSYNTTSTDNSVTYGDITNYVNNYYGQNGTYPTPEQIKIQIEIIQSSGSGGGGSGGGSGGDSGGSGDGSSIWEFLSRLGEVLGGLIKNLGNMLTSLIDSIVTIINDVIGKIPQVFNGLLEVVFGGLPDDMRAIIILGITVMVVYGIIKVIRG